VASRILITGGSGLIGSRVLPLINAAGLRYILLEDAVSDWDMLAPGAPGRILARTQPSAVLHLAWVASGTPGYRRHADNGRWAVATAELALGCLDRGSWFIGTGTVAELEQEPQDDYTEAKSWIFRTLEPEIAEGRVTWLRPHYVFDPKSRRPEVMAEVMSAISDGRAPDLRDPGASHDFIHVDDAAAGIVAAMATGMRGLVPLGSGTNHTVAQLARASGATGVDDISPEESRDRFTADTHRLADVGWYPRWTKEYFDD
jgi:nucleoside-diphosphate-sugar epimerase